MLDQLGVEKGSLVSTSPATFPLDNFASGRELTVTARGPDGVKEFRAVVRIDTPQEVLYYQHGGILQYVLRQLLNQK